MSLVSEILHIEMCSRFLEYPALMKIFGYSICITFAFQIVKYESSPRNDDCILDLHKFLDHLVSNIL